MNKLYYFVKKIGIDFSFIFFIVQESVSFNTIAVLLFINFVKAGETKNFLFSIRGWIRLFYDSSFVVWICHKPHCEICNLLIFLLLSRSSFPIIAWEIASRIRPDLNFCFQSLTWLCFYIRLFSAVVGAFQSASRIAVCGPLRPRVLKVLPHN